MSEKVKHGGVMELNLSQLRRKARLTQKDVAQHFGFNPEQGYKSVGEWESGTAKPLDGRRERFISYLWDRLKLRNDPQEFERIWQILAKEWEWALISDEEWIELFPGVARPGHNLNIVQLKSSEVSEQTSMRVAPTKTSPPLSRLAYRMQTTKWLNWLSISTLLITAGLMARGAGAWKLGCLTSGKIEPNGLVGVIDIDPKGLSKIQGYDLWFTNRAKDRWQIWCLDTRSGQVKPLDFKVNGGLFLFDQFVPAVSPTGNQIAFATSPCPATERCGRDLYLASLANLNAYPLVTDPCLDEYHPAWSSDGQYIAYHAGSDDLLGCSTTPYGIWVIDVQKRGKPSQLTKGRDYDPVWSPSGRYIAYHSGSAAWNIMVLDYQSCATSANPCKIWQVTELGNKVTSVSWVNDHKIVFVSGQERARDIYEILVKHDKTYLNPTQLTHNRWDDEYPSVFDGKILLWQAFQYEDKSDEGVRADRNAVIYVMDLQHGEELPLITGIGNARDGFLSRHQ
jgi:Tol biopolymer transport system component